ncbi:Tripartite tricarboxylate transporter family receptor [Pigmentiphaga humi]|uniref:Tripartite tricarboxylate transporter family receptor n=1 Tax=Pigmentiphaga humi TaxID=2478468 RepID=A0A3P4B6N1_9BURK|nr:tripartite tricarboxylate transporter substrate binding protein [Pigmentiphaga humi]VCU71742.1 Tripartite tricarboxylate transporter family receptor [Pigmentiphaga humi]
MKHLLCALQTLAVLAVAPASAQTAWKPDHPIRTIVPFAPGAAADTTIRIVSEELATALGQPVVVENRGGAAGVIGTRAGATAAPDGYTLIGGSDPPFTILPHLQTVPYDPATAFAHVALVADVPLFLVVRKDLGVSNVRELIAHAQKQPGSLTIASSGNGSSGHLAAELFKIMAAAPMLHVPYKGQVAAVSDVVAGRVDATFSSLAPVRQHVEAGTLKMLAVSTAKRFAALPDVPTVNEAGVPGFDIAVWIGFSAPAGTPPQAVARINQEINKILRTPKIGEKLTGMGYVPLPGSPADMTDRLDNDYKRFGKLVKDARITVE